MTQLFIPTNKGIKAVMVQDIIRVEARRNYCRVYIKNEYPLTVAKVLQWFEDHLPEDFFYRIHRTHLVSRLYISEISAASVVIMTSGEQLQVSRRKRGIITRMNAISFGYFDMTLNVAG
jgi:two-component system LytT family response regulator